MDAVSYSLASKQAQRIEKFIENPDSTSGIVTVPKTIASGETVTIPAGRVAILPNVKIDGVLNVDGEVFIPSGAGFNDLDKRIDTLDNTTVKLTGNQTIAGIKTFSSNIVGNITGNAGTATNASKLGGNVPSYYQQALGFTPIQQGGGASQGTNKIFIGWQGPYLRCQVDGTDFGTTFPMNITGNSGTATIAADSNKLVGKNWYWSGQGGQPNWLWGGSDGTNMYVYNPSNFNVNYANSATYAAAFTTAVGAAPSYACRAWVNFNGTGTVYIRASGNVSSITDNGVGNYTVNFTTAMPDANYSIIGTAREDSVSNSANFTLGIDGIPLPQAGSFNVVLTNNVNNGTTDSTIICASVFR